MRETSVHVAWEGRAASCLLSAHLCLAEVPGVDRLLSPHQHHTERLTDASWSGDGDLLFRRTDRSPYPLLHAVFPQDLQVSLTLQAHPEARCLVSGVPGAARSVLPSTSTGPWARLLPAWSQGACISPQHSLRAPEDPPCSV